MAEKLETILILAHPGHELRVHHWLEITRPRVYLLTDGSGGRGTARTHFSRQLVEAAGAIPGAVFGDIADAVWYEALLATDHDFFGGILSKIYADLPPAQGFQIVSDAADGYNPVHDLAYAYGQALTTRLEGAAKVRKHLCSAAIPNVAGVNELSVSLDAAARARKMAAVERYSPLAEEARRILDADPQCFDRENLISQHFDWNSPWTPEWEQIGKERVAAGAYRKCITYKDNFQPVARHLNLGSIAEPRNSPG